MAELTNLSKNSIIVICIYEYTKIFYGKLQEVIMGIKENDLEELILDLLDKSTAVRKK